MKFINNQKYEHFLHLLKQNLLNEFVAIFSTAVSTVIGWFKVVLMR